MVIVMAPTSDARGIETDEGAQYVLRLCSNFLDNISKVSDEEEDCIWRLCGDTQYVLYWTGFITAHLKVIIFVTSE